MAGDRPVPPDAGDVMKILVAGIGNIFLADDGFGVEVVTRLRDQSLGDSVDVVDFGVRGIHLAYSLTDGGYAAAVLVDAVSRGGPPGTLYAIEADLSGIDPAPESVDAHNLTPDAVLAMVRQLGGSIARIVVIGCEPATTDEAMELSAPVAASVDGAIAMIRELVAELKGALPCV
jgi:hydrogenase maturation protease